MILDLLNAEAKKNPGRWTRIAAAIRGVSEETTTGVHRLYEMMRAGTRLFPSRVFLHHWSVFHHAKPGARRRPNDLWAAVQALPLPS